MQIEYIAWIGLASRWTAEEQRYLAVGRSLFRKIVIDYERMSSSVAKVLAECCTRIRRDKLKWRRIGGGCGNDRRVLVRTLFFELRTHVRNRRCLLANGDVNTIDRIYSAGLRFRCVGILLIDDRVDR